VGPPVRETIEHMDRIFIMLSDCKVRETTEVNYRTTLMF